MQARNEEPLAMLIDKSLDKSDAERAQTQFVRASLAHILAYAASLIPEVTKTP